MSGKLRMLCAMFVTVLGAWAAPTFAQNNGGGGGGRPNYQQMRQDYMNGLKADLGATDDEFGAIQPKIETVMTMQRDAMSGGMFGRGRGRGGGGQGGGNATPSAVQAASDDLKKTLDNKDSTPDDIKSKLQALRDARKTAKDDLVKAQEDLKGLLSSRQEAVMVQHGLLE